MKIINKKKYIAHKLHQKRSKWNSESCKLRALKTFEVDLMDLESVSNEVPKNKFRNKKYIKKSTKGLQNSLEKTQTRKKEKLYQKMNPKKDSHSNVPSVGRTTRSKARV